MLTCKDKLPSGINEIAVCCVGINAFFIILLIMGLAVILLVTFAQNLSSNINKWILLCVV